MTDRSSWEPRRWSAAESDAPEPLRAALEEARTLTIDHARVMRLAERVGVQTSVAAGVGLSSVAPPASVAAFKLWMYLSGAVAVSGVALVVWTQLAPARADVAIADVAAIESRAVATDPLLAAPSASPQTLDDAFLPGAMVALEATPAAPVRDRSASSARPATRRRAQATPAAAVAVAAPTVVHHKLDPQAELSILNRAQDALAQAPRRALTLATEHAQGFPQGVFAQEREVIAIEALLKLQRTGDATVRGEAFLTAFPGSTHAPRVQQMLRQPQ